MTFTNFIIVVLVLALIIIVLAQISKVADLLRNLVSNQEKAEEDSSNLYATIWAIVGFGGIALLAYSFFHEKDKYLPVGASELARDSDFAFWVYTIPIVLIFLITHFLLFFFSYKYRYKVGRVVHYYPENNKLEIIWTSVPLVVVLGLGIYTTPKWLKATGSPSEDAIHIKITGQQFKWFIAYAGENDEFGDRDVIEFGGPSNMLGLDPQDSRGYDDLYTEEIVVPVNHEIAFDLTALDVLHDFYLPHFRVKMDCIPGVPTRIKITPDITTEEMKVITENPNFEYEIACAELCGSGHWNMKKVLRVVSLEEYNTWKTEQVLAKDIYYDSLLAQEKEQELENDTKVTEVDEEHTDSSHDTASL